MINNPFQLTRAADLDDTQISTLWVDPKEKFQGLLKPFSPLPMLIIGGRGSGKTHLLRYYSYPVQKKMQGPQKMLDWVTSTKYLGIHTRCLGLNTNRFSSKRMSDEHWQALFAFHVELWFGQLLLNNAISFIEDANHFETFEESSLVRDLCNLFDQQLPTNPQTLHQFSKVLRDLQRELDVQVNMASFRKVVSPKIIVSSGRLTFGIPKLLCEQVPCLKGILFTLFVDEYEHLYKEQQTYINTLIRERENPVSFKIGARPHGLRTYKTLGGDEELKEGSDYELLNLDSVLREQKSDYEDFAYELCIARIRYDQKGLPRGWTETNLKECFINTFELASDAESIVSRKLHAKEASSPWLKRVKSSLLSDTGKIKELGVYDNHAIDTIEANLQFNKNPLIEKTNTFLFYHAWSNRENLVQASKLISESAAKYSLTKDPDSLHAKKLQHFKSDMKDQMFFDLDLGSKAGANGILTNYVGPEKWIKISDGIARNLLIILKHVYDWALFRGEEIYAKGGISLDSQIKGIQRSSTWFVADANVLEVDRGMVEAGIKRISTLLRKLRFSEKPPECSLCRFSVDLNALQPRAKSIIEAAEMWSLLIRDSDRKSRNPRINQVQYRINRLVAPDYYLPISARGSIELSEQEAQSIFGEIDEAHYRSVEVERMSRCIPPFSNNPKRSSQSKSNQSHKPEDELPLF